MQRNAAKLAILFTIAAAGCAGIASNTDTTPTNDLPNPYRSVSPCGSLPSGHSKWGALNGVAIYNDGRSVSAGPRCVANPHGPAWQSPLLLRTRADSRPCTA